MSNELKPCPFCGGEASALLDDDDCPYICCTYCHFDMAAYRPGFEHMAIAAWNRRATSGAASGEVTFDQAILLAGIQVLCISGDQEWCRQKGQLSEFDKGWFTGQLHIFDMYTGVEKSAIAEARAYIEKLSATPAPAEQSAPPVPPMDQSSCIPPSRAEPASLDNDARVEEIGEVAELYGRLLAHKQRVHAENGRDRGTEYYIADGIRWAIGELDRRCRAQGGITNDNDSNSLATQSASTAPGQAETERDAARYRWLRDHGDTEHQPCVLFNGHWYGGSNGVGFDLDAAIDSAIDALSKEKP